MRIAINGMGRIGRLLFRRLVEDKHFEIVAINDLMPAHNLAYLLKYDSVYGTFTPPISKEEDSFVVLNQKIKVFQTEDPADLPWEELDIDVVIESTGVFIDKTSVEKHLSAGAKKVLLATTSSDDIELKVFGHNQHEGVSALTMLSPGGCMTNCSVHILHLLNSIGIIGAQINILHSYTSRQALVDAAHNQYRRGRAAAESIIPVDIDLYKSLNRLLPVLKNKIHASSTRVPVANGAMANFYIQLTSEVTVAQINQLFKKAAENEYKDILEYTEEPLVSLDIKGNTHSCIVDGTQTSVIGNQVRVVAWFDNEFGFTSRMIDWLRYWK